MNPPHPCLAFGICLAFVLGIWSHASEGRVSRTECAGFFADVPLAGEALNDAASYAWVRDWDQQWNEQGDRDSSAAAARISAGSLDARKFLYHEQIRLQAAPQGNALWIFLQREKQESANEYRFSYCSFILIITIIITSNSTCANITFCANFSIANIA